MFENLKIKNNNEVKKTVNFVVDTIAESGSYVYTAFESGKDASNKIVAGAFDKDTNKKVAALKIIYNILTGAKVGGKLIIDGANQINIFIGEKAKATYHNALIDAKDQAHCDKTFNNLLAHNAAEDVTRYQQIYQLVIEQIWQLNQAGVVINVVSLFDVYYAKAEISDPSKYTWTVDNKNKKFPKETTTIRMVSYGQDGSKTVDGNVTTKNGGFGEGTDVILMREKVTKNGIETYEYIVEKLYYCNGTGEKVTAQQAVKSFNEYTVLSKKGELTAKEQKRLEKVINSVKFSTDARYPKYGCVILDIMRAAYCRSMIKEYIYQECGINVGSMIDTIGEIEYADE